MIRPLFCGIAIVLGFGAHAAAKPPVAITIPPHTTVGWQSLPSGGSLVNNGTIAGGTHTGVTAGGTAPVTIINNGTITSSTTGIATSGNNSSTIINTGTISVTSSSSSVSGHAVSTVTTGISQSVGH